MAANLAEGVLINTFANLLSLPTLNNIGGITIDTTIEEIYEDAVEATSHPVESGAEITDHSFKRPMEIRLRCGWSDASATALLGIVGNFLSGSGSAASATGGFTGGAMAASDYVAGVYSQLLALQESRQTFSMVSGLRSYDTMLLTNLRVQRDQRTYAALMVEATCRQIIVVSTSSTTVTPQANQANPASTAGVQNSGAQQLQPGAPAQGGSLTPSAFVP